MSATIEVVSEVVRKMSIVIPAKVVEDAAEKRLQEASKTAKIDGFRPGKVPADVLKKRYGKALRMEAIGDAMQEAFSKAVTEQKLSPLALPDVEITQDEMGKDVHFTATFEVYPEVEIKGLDQIKLERVAAEVTEADVDQMLETLRKQQAAWTDVKRPAKNEDRLMIDFEGERDGKTFEGGSAKDVPLVLGSKQMIAGFEDGLVGAVAGDTRILDLTFPADYFAKDLAGQPVRFTVHVKAVSSAELPELNDELAKRFNTETLEALRKEVRGNMERELEFSLKNRFKMSLMNALLEQNKIVVPKALVTQEVAHLREQSERQMRMYAKGMKLPELPDSVFEPEATRRVELGVLMNKVIRTHDIKPDQDRVKETLRKLVSVYEDPNEALMQALRDKNQVAQVEQSVLEEMVVEQLCQAITVTEVVKGFYDVMRDQGRAQG